MLLWETEIQHRYYRSPTMGPIWPVGVWEGGLEQHQRGKKRILAWKVKQELL